jgi:WD40 repeat protein
VRRKHLYWAGVLFWVLVAGLAQPTARAGAFPGLAITPSPVPFTRMLRSLADLPAITPQNVATLTQLAEIRFGPWELVMAVAWSPDGANLAVSAGDAIYVYRTQDWQQLSSFEIGALTHSLAYSPDGAWLASGSRDGYVRVWAAADLVNPGQVSPVLALQAHRKGVNSVAFSPPSGSQGNIILASGGNDAVARFWDPGSGENLGLMVGGTFAVPSIAFLSDGSQLAVTNGDRIRLRQVGSERIVGTFASDEPLYSLTVSPEGGLLAAGGSDNLVRLWKPEQAFSTSQQEYIEPVLLTGHEGRPGTYRSLIWQVAFSPSGELLASAGGDATIRLWDILSGGLLQTILAHPGGATSIAFHPDGRVLASGGLDGVVRIWGPLP